MRDLDRASRIVAATVAAARVPVTVKMRLGWDDGSRNAPELARRAEALGVAALTVHGRTRQQFYKGAADWAAIAAPSGPSRSPSPRTATSARRRMPACACSVPAPRP